MGNLTVSQIEEILNKYDLMDFHQAKMQFINDDRKSVQNLLKKYERKHENLLKKLNEFKLRKKYEENLWNNNIKLVAGIDEVGRGPLAGPVYAAAVILSPETQILEIKDSKKLSEEMRNKLSREIKLGCIDYSIGCASVVEIERYNILNATRLAMKRAVEGLVHRPEHLLIDALTLNEIDIPQTPIIKGDDLSISIGAASIIAKVERDTYMETISNEYPEYMFEKNKGYGTSEHTDAIKKYGICEHHRKSFVKNFI